MSRLGDQHFECYCCGHRRYCCGCSFYECQQCHKCQTHCHCPSGFKTVADSVNEKLTAQTLQLQEENARLKEQLETSKAEIEQLKGSVPASNKTSWQFGVVRLHSNKELQSRFYQVVDDLRRAGCIVDLWINDIMLVLKEFGYQMDIYEIVEQKPGN